MGKGRKTDSRSRAVRHVFPGVRDVQSGRFGVPGEAKWPLSDSKLQGPGDRAGFAFSSPLKEDSRPSSNFEKSMGDRKLELRRLMGLFIGAGGCLFWMPYKHPRYLRASHFPPSPSPRVGRASQAGPRLRLRVLWATEKGKRKRGAARPCPRSQWGELRPEWRTSWCGALSRT